MRPIPKKYRKLIDIDPFYDVCCCPGCHSRAVQLHHSLYYGSSGKQIAEVVVPVCIEHHDELSPRNKIWFQIVAIQKYTIKYLQINYPKRNWTVEWELLHERYKQYD
jgi:hypothetical protein